MAKHEKREIDELFRLSLPKTILKKVGNRIKKNFKTHGFDINHFMQLLGAPVDQVNEPKPKALPKYDKLLVDLLLVLGEIDECLKALDYCIKRIKTVSRSPLTAKYKGISRSQFFYFYFYAFIEESYTIIQRIERIKYTISRKKLSPIRHTSREANKIILEMKRLNKAFNEAMDFVNKYRGVRKHEMNITIEKLEQLRRVELFEPHLNEFAKEFGDMNVLQFLSWKNYREAQRECLQLLQVWRKNIFFALKLYFKRLEPIIFDSMKKILK